MKHAFFSVLFSLLHNFLAYLHEYVVKKRKENRINSSHEKEV